MRAQKGDEKEVEEEDAMDRRNIDTRLRNGSEDSNSSWGIHESNTNLTSSLRHSNNNLITSLHQSNTNTANTTTVIHDDSGHSSAGEGPGGVQSGGESVGLTDHTIKSIGHDSHYSTHFANDGKHSLLQFALKYFRQAKDMVAADGTLQTNKDKSKKKKTSKDNAADWTWKEQVCFKIYVPFWAICVIDIVL